MRKRADFFRNFGKDVIFDHFYYFALLIFALVLIRDLLSQGYILTLDMVFAPHVFEITDSFYGFRDLYSALPLFILLDFLTKFFSVAFIQKMIFLFVFFVSGVSAYKMCPVEWRYGRYFASFLYMFNPFIYIRFLAGHWTILLAYALIPFIIKSFVDFFDAPSIKRSIYIVFLFTFIFALEPHTPFLLMFVFAIFYIMNMIEMRKNLTGMLELSKTVFLIIISLLILNSYWLVPSFTGNDIPLREITGSDLYTFTTRQDINFNTLFTTASMYGFWRGGYIYTKDLLPMWYLFFIFILFLAVHGFISNYDHPEHGIYVRSFGIIAVLSVLLAAGISGPFGNMFEFLFNNVFFFKGFREPHKFVALLVLAYAYLGGLGVAELGKIAGIKVPGRGAYNKFGAWLLIAIALSTPFIYSFTMFNGFWGQLKPTDYPEDWYEVNAFLVRDKQDFNVLFLPWHLYMDFKWLPTPQKRIENPADIFFDKPVIQGENMEAGQIYSSSSNPVSGYIDFLLTKKDEIDNFGELVAPLNVKYIIIAKEADYKKYDFLYEQVDLELVKDTENLVVFRNRHPVSMFYQVDSVITIKSWDDLLEFSRTGDITSAAFAFGNEKTFRASQGQALDHTAVSPVKYALDRPSKDYLLFSGRYSQDWKFDGKTPFANFGVTNAYDISGMGENTLYYERFNIYLLGYIISGIAFILLLIIYSSESVRRRIGL